MQTILYSIAAKAFDTPTTTKSYMYAKKHNCLISLQRKQETYGLPLALHLPEGSNSVAIATMLNNM